MKITLLNINTLLVKEDIESLIEAGAPADESADEAAQIAAAISHLKEGEVTEDSVVSVISLVWIKSFELAAEDMEARLPAIHRVAKATIA